MIKNLRLIFCFLLVAKFSFTQITITDADLAGGQAYNWTNDNIYLLDGYVFLEEGGTLNIEAGTVIKGLVDPTNGTDNASALIIGKGAQIFASGSPEAPIIFTAEDDNTSDPTDFLVTDRGEWGGLIILGNAPINNEGGSTNIEGIPSDNGKAIYGGTDIADNSGVLKYVSIRHGGAVLQANDEINGLTLGGVGNGTVIDYIEVIANDDDGIEWFGGTVDVKHAIVAFCADDAMDTDDGWAGRLQYGFVIQGDDRADNGGEHDGGSAANMSNFSDPIFANCTYIGSGSENNGKDGLKNGHALHFKEKVGGGYYNSIFTDFANEGLEVEDIPSSEGFDAYENLQNGKLTLSGNIWFGFGTGSTWDDIILITDGADDDDASDLKAHLAANNNQIVDPQIQGISRTADQGLDPTLKGGSPAGTGAQELEDTWFDDVDYIGAFDKKNWALGWTATDEYGFFGDLRTISQVTIKDEDLVAGETYSWTNDTEYLLDGYVFLETGGKLNIERGTVIRGLIDPSNGTDNASALIIGRGAQICAVGSADNPVIFTAEDDDINDPNDFTAQDRGEWGGLIILGAAPINNEGGETNVEGIPSDNDKAKYGGSDTADNSGVLKYVSVRHGGAVLQANDEINGITLAGVGNGTSIEYVEVFANDDDGIEWFGGSVDVKHAVVSFCRDDAMDTDDGWSGRLQFGFVIQGDDVADNGGEHDGGSAATPDNFSSPIFANCTYIGSGVENNGKDGLKNAHALHFKEKAGGGYYNSIFTDFANEGLEVEDIPSSEGFDAYENLQNGKLTLSTNIWFGFGTGSTWDDIILITDGGDDDDASDLKAHLAANNNQIIDPQIQGISREADQGLDPTLRAGSPALTGAVDLGDNFFEDVAYIGAFDKTNWALGWTATDEYGYFGQLQTTSIFDPITNEQLANIQAFPNPATNYIQVTISLKEATTLNMQLFDVQGKLVNTFIANNRLSEGDHNFELNLAPISNGIYFLTISDIKNVITKKLIINK